MSEPLTTLLSNVNTWEMDRNGHMNVRFYFDRFERAEAHHRLLTGAGISPRRLSRHIRFHTELFDETAIFVVSEPVAGADEGAVLHRLVAAEENRLSATALDHYDDAAPFGAAVNPAPPECLPRSLASGPSPQPGSVEATLADHGVISYRTVVAVADCHADGGLTDRAAIGFASEGGPHVWNQFGLSTKWLRDNGYGRAIVEMKISWHGIAKPGDALISATRLTDVGAKAVSFRHVLYNAVSGASVASVETVGLTIDLKARRAVALPDDQRATALQRIAERGSG